MEDKLEILRDILEDYETDKLSQQDIDDIIEIIDYVYELKTNVNKLEEITMGIGSEREHIKSKILDDFIWNTNNFKYLKG